MGLIDLKTDLKSLRYGKDTIGGGYSGQPYIQTPIPESFNDLGANEDFILRGGINAVRDSVTDIKRLTKMFFDLKSPNGLLFIAKQNVLSNVAVRTQTSKYINEGIYTPLSTLAEAGVLAFGYHLNKQGINPFEKTGAYANNPNLYSVKVKTDQLTENNRLARLYQLISTNASDKLDGFTLNNGNVLTYDGGPNSILGIGKTNIRFPSPEQRTGKQNKYFVDNNNFFIGKNNQRSVNSDNKQVGGLKIDSEKLWTKSPQYPLPDFSVNSPQSSSFAQSNNRQYNIDSSTAKQNITGSTDGGKYEIYNPLLTGISERGGLYDALLGVGEVEVNGRDFEGNRLQQNNVYNPGTLDQYTPVTTGEFSQKIQKSVNSDNKSVGGLQVETGDGTKPWIRGGVYFDGNGKNRYSVNASGSNGLPSKNVNSPQSASLSDIPDASKSIAPQDRNNPYGITYRIGTPTSIEYNVSGSKGVTNILGSGQPLFVTPSVYQPSGSGKSLLSPNTSKARSTGPALNNNTFTYVNPFVNINTNKNEGKYNGSPLIQDFRKILRASLDETTRKQSNESGATPNAPDYVLGNIGVKTQIGNPGQRSGKNYVSYTNGITYSGIIKALDQINASPIGTQVFSEGGSGKDLVTFNITPFDGSATMNFRAFLGSFSDNYSSKLNTQQYVGRGEDFYTYTGFTRKISLSWTVAALSKQELIPMYKKLSYLASNTAPVYKDGFMQGPLVKLTVGGYIHALPGYIDSLTLEMGEDSTWEIGINDTDGLRDPTVAQLTHIIKVTGFSFTPIPTYLPQRGAHFIDLWNGSKTLWTVNNEPTPSGSTPIDNAVSLT